MRGDSKRPAARRKERGPWLTGRQSAVIRDMFADARLDLQAAARRHGVGHLALRNWLRDRKFRRELEMVRQLQQQRLEHARLLGLVRPEVLDGLMEPPPTGRAERPAGAGQAELSPPPSGPEQARPLTPEQMDDLMRRAKEHNRG